jgi:hypothetical protein
MIYCPLTQRLALEPQAVRRQYTVRRADTAHIAATASTTPPRPLSRAPAARDIPTMQPTQPPPPPVRYTR